MSLTSDLDLTDLAYTIVAQAPVEQLTQSKGITA